MGTVILVKPGTPFLRVSFRSSGMFNGEEQRREKGLIRSLTLFHCGRTAEEWYSLKTPSPLSRFSIGTDFYYGSAGIQFLKHGLKRERNCFSD
jgi:hypothetical protein